MSPCASRSRCRPARPALHGRQDGDADAGGVGERRDGLEVLARQNLGRRHQGAGPGRDRGRAGEQRHHGLAGADIALQQPQHAVGLGEVAHDVRDGAALAGGECEGRRW